MNIDILLTYKEFVNNAKTFKRTYNVLLTSFSLIHPRLANEFIQKTKKSIYSLSFELWKRDLCWEYLNGDQKLSHLRAFIR